MTPDITKLFIGSHIDSNNNYGLKLNNITESIYECRQSFASDSAPLTLVLFGTFGFNIPMVQIKLTMFFSFRKGVFDLYSDKRNRTAEIISKQVPMVVCSKLKASESRESLAKKSQILANSYRCEWFSLNGPIANFNFIADGV